MDPVEAALNAIAVEAKREVESRLGYRLSLLTIDVTAKAFNLFHLPSTSARQVEYAKNVAAEVYPLFAERIESPLGEAD